MASKVRLLRPGATARRLGLLGEAACRSQERSVSGAAIASLCGSTTSTRALSSSTAQEPARYVQGVSADDLETDPNIASFFAANFSDQKDEEHTSNDGDDALLNPIGDEQEAEDTATPERATAAIDDALLARNIRPLSCFLRPRDTEEGTRACENLREVHKQIPGILYGSDPTKSVVSKHADSKATVKTPWNQVQRELDRYHHAFESRVYELTVYESEEAADAEGGEGLYKQLVIPANMQRHPIQNKIYCVNYLRYHPGRPIKIPIRYINEEESPALKRGGFIVPISRTIECFVEDGAVIPESIDLECTGIQMKQVLRTERLIWPDGVRPSHRVKPDYLVGLIYGKRAGEEEEEEGESAEVAEEAS